MLGCWCHSQVLRAGLEHLPASKTSTSQQAKGQHHPCETERSFPGLVVTPGPQQEGEHRCGEGVRLVSACVAWPSFASWNMLKAGLSELLFLVLFLF